jgi:hypothetical protein
LRGIFCIFYKLNSDFFSISTLNSHYMRSTLNWFLHSLKLTLINFRNKSLICYRRSHIGFPCLARWQLHGLGGRILIGYQAQVVADAF